MNLHLENTAIFLTGASSGIGAAAALAFAAEGADVVIGYGQNQAGAETTAEKVRALGRTAFPLSLNLADPASLPHALQSLPARFAQLDALALCAGENIVTPLAEISPAEWDHVMTVNLGGPFFLVQALLPYLKEGSSVTLVSSVASQTGNAQHIHYAAAKAGLNNLTKSLARALAPRVRVNCVAPGVTRTAMGMATVPADYPRKNLLVPRFAEPEEIAACIVFVASPLCGFMTGATLDVNGGRMLR